EMLAEATQSLPNVRCETFSGLVVEYARSRGATVIVRGVRSPSDCEYELQMAGMNRDLDAGIETLLLPTAPHFAHVRSSLVKEVAGLGGPVDQWVPENVSRRLLARLEAKDGAGQ